jgi:hypothetical protein
MTNPLPPELFRVCDANLNRLKEGIRVVEDIARYHANEKKLAASLKELRHRAKVDDLQNFLEYRDSTNDVLRISTASEMGRESIQSIVTANFKRSQESARVLEELYKLANPQISENFKSIRYALYTLEKEFMKITSNSK